MKWISVEYRFPELDKHVLGVNEYGEYAVVYRDKPWGSEPDGWFQDILGVFFPTHWMPLPNPPKKN